MTSDLPEPPGPHWALDLPGGATVEEPADSPCREAGAVAELASSPVWVRRGGGPWREITAEQRRR